MFVPRFIEARPPKGRRKNEFPQNRNELIVATTQRFCGEGKAVLIYCPLRTSVEGLAEEFLTAHQQGYFECKLSESHASQIAHAVQIGKEWLGAAHPAVRALSIGVAVHHGQLPRAFLGEIERLLKDRMLSIAISSPTLAQGVDLSFEVLIFSSLWRSGRLIRSMEFANVVGRVGRAHVDIDGIYILPVYEFDRKKKAVDTATRNQRLREFRDLDDQAKHRQMESGILLLLKYMLVLLAEKLQVPVTDVGEYILNNQNTWPNAVLGDDDKSKWLMAAANELDNAIFSIVADLACTPDEIADKLDAALKDSFWQKRLATLPPEEQRGQISLLRGRAKWLWDSTSPEKRRGFFSAGIGYSAGEAIASRAEELGALLAAGELAVQSGDADTAGKAATAIAEHLLIVYPFACDLPEEWKELVSGWISGRPTSAFADSNGIAFIQDGLVYRLVWAIESVRTTLEALGTLPAGCEAGHFALCVTYGVPNVPAALVQQAGLSSRRLAVELVKQLQLSFSDADGLKAWLEEVSDGKVKPQLTGDDKDEWDRFVKQLENAKAAKWYDAEGPLEAHWHGKAPKPGTMLRVAKTPDEQSIELLTPDFELLGHIQGHNLFARGMYSCVVSDDPRQVDLRYFGPGEAGKRR